MPRDCRNGTLTVWFYIIESDWVYRQSLQAEINLDIHYLCSIEPKLNVPRSVFYRKKNTRITAHLNFTYRHAILHRMYFWTFWSSTRAKVLLKSETKGEARCLNLQAAIKTKYHAAIYHPFSKCIIQCTIKLVLPRESRDNSNVHTVTQHIWQPHFTRL